jgi:hypothetical protein
MDQHEHPGQPQRPPASAHLLIDSLDRYKSLNLGGQETDPLINWVLGQAPAANDFQISRNGALLYGYFTRVGITQIQLTYAVPTVIQGVNDVGFILRDVSPAVPEDIFTLTPGYYTPTELAAELETAIRAIGPQYAAYTAQLTTDNKIVVQSNSAETFVFPDPTVVADGYSVKVAKNWNLLGIGSGNGGINVATTQYFDRCPNLLYTRYVDIRSNTLTKFQRVKDADTSVDKNKTSIIARVYLTPPGQAYKVLADSAPGDAEFTLCVDYNTPKHIRWSPDEAIYSLDFQLYDEFGDLLYWDKEWPTEYQLTMIASET